ncbi:MAG: Ketoisovalerate oxidoreductase subunit VorB [Candidatus Thorarchaeota archaeon]|nr:MAG: Ketoisovalerate oxidoreductase subunit VorB [Candidatus Thorarchaeota archaeon]
MMVATKEIPLKEYVLKGNAACAGCQDMVALRHAHKALEGDVIQVVPACCTSVVQSLWPKVGMNIPILNTAFMASGATASGVKAALRAKGKDDTTVMVWAGDGGTFDIGLQALSGAFERRTDMLYVCYNNQVYSNTGTQRSGATPLYAQTTTTWFGKREPEKLLDLIVAMHEPAYQATANAAYPRDLFDKFKRAKEIKGPKFIHIFIPCPQAWNYPVEKGVEIGKLAVETGYWIMWERIGDKFELGRHSKRFQDPSKRKPIEDFLKLQGRFSRLFKPEKDEEKIKEIEDYIQHRWDILLKTLT